jgi:hypothetical protein
MGAQRREHGRGDFGAMKVIRLHRAHFLRPPAVVFFGEG